jgi:hypothetical protein
MAPLARAALALFALLVPRVALACPYCTTTLDRYATTLKLVGLFLLVPFLISAVVIQVIRRVSAEAAELAAEPGSAGRSQPR